MTLKYLATAVAALLAFTPVPSIAQQPQTRVVNITSDSAAGWIPDVAQEAEAVRVALAYLKAQDEGRAREAYDMMSAGNRRTQPFESYSAYVTSLNAKSGAAIEHRVLKVTWTKDGPNVPAPGIYAAIDLASRYAKIGRHCGYVVAYQASEGGPFEIARYQSTMMTDDDAAAIERTSGRAEMDRVWRMASATCPGGTG